MDKSLTTTTRRRFLKVLGGGLVAATVFGNPSFSLAKQIGTAVGRSRGFVRIPVVHGIGRIATWVDDTEQSPSDALKLDATLLMADIIVDLEVFEGLTPDELRRGREIVSDDPHRWKEVPWIHGMQPFESTERLPALAQEMIRELDRGILCGSSLEEAKPRGLLSITDPNA